MKEAQRYLTRPTCTTCNCRAEWFLFPLWMMWQRWRGGGGGERRCFAAPRLRRVWERFACLSRRYFDLTWLLHATFLTGIVNSRGITSSGKINSWLTNHYFLTHPHYFPVNSKALIKPSERVNATKARDLFCTRRIRRVWHLWRIRYPRGRLWLRRQRTWWV